MNKLFLILILLISNFAHAVDATSNASKKNKFGDWELIEFALPKGLLYRISTTSFLSKKEYLTFDFLPNVACRPDPAVMIKEFKHYDKNLDNGMLLYEYKIPGKDSSVEIVNISMQKDDKFAFFVFQKLTAEILLDVSADGRLALWIPASADGVVKRSANLYFSLNGIRDAFNQAKKLCLHNN